MPRTRRRWTAAARAMAAAGLVLVGRTAGGGEARRESPPAPPASVARYARWEITLPDAQVRRGRALHPLDPAQIRLDLTLTFPDGRIVAVPGYYDQPCERVAVRGAARTRAVTDPAFGFVRGDGPDDRPDAAPTGGAPDRAAAAPDDDHDHDRAPEGPGGAEPAPAVEYWRPAGPAVWRARFTPGRGGAYRYVVTATAEGGAGEELARGTFTVTPPAAPAGGTAPNRGMLRPHPARANRFRRDDGEAVFLIGHNVAWTTGERTVGGFEEIFDRMAAAGENFTRVWMCTWSLALETKTPYAYHLGRAAQLDAVLDAAERRGIAVMLCLDNFHDFLHNWDAPANPAASPYAAANGGPCATRADFFRDPRARAQYAARLRYLVARYGAYRSLMAWELWNEQNYALTNAMLRDARATLSHLFEDGPVPGSAAADGLPAAPPDPNPARDDVHLPWVDWAAGEIRRLDAAHGHMVTTSLGQYGHWPSLWRRPSMDVVQLHAYVRSDAYRRTPLENDAAAFVAAAQRPLDAYGKPAFLAEFGFSGEGNRSTLAERDAAGVMLRQSLWAGLFSGAAGTPMWWWWDYYLHPNDLYRHYAGLSRFLEGVDWNDRFVPRRAESDRLRAWSLSSGRRALVWLENLGWTWPSAVLEGRSPRPVGRSSMAVTGAEPGAWTVEWLDTATGEVLERSAARVGADRRLALSAPAFAADLAGRAWRAGE